MNKPLVLSCSVVLTVISTAFLCGCETLTALHNNDISMSQILNLEEEQQRAVYYVDTHEKYVDLPEEPQAPMSLPQPPVQVKRSDYWFKENLW